MVVVLEIDNPTNNSVAWFAPPVVGSTPTYPFQVLMQLQTTFHPNSFMKKRLCLGLPINKIKLQLNNTQIFVEWDKAFG